MAQQKEHDKIAALQWILSTVAIYWCLPFFSLVLPLHTSTTVNLHCVVLFIGDQLETLRAMSNVLSQRDVNQRNRQVR